MLGLWWILSMKCQAVIFDFDGIIVDSEPLHHKAFVRVFDPINLPFTWERYYDHYLGFDDRDVIRERFKEAGRSLDDDTLAKIMQDKAGHFVDIVERDGVQPYSGVVPLIKQLSGRIPMAICSGALRSDIDPILRILHLQGSMNEMVTADQVQVSKPDPESYHLAFSRLQESFPGQVTDPGRCVAVEDTPAGIAAAKGAGLKVIAVTNTYPREALGDANQVVASLEGMTPGDFDSILA